MQESFQKASNMQGGGKFIDALIEKWTKRTGSDIVLKKAQEQTEGTTAQEGKQQISGQQERTIQILQRKLQQCEETAASLSTSLETEIRNKEEIQTKLNATWESIDTITEYFNYVSESLTSFQEHRANLSATYDNVILKQQEVIEEMRLKNARLIAATVIFVIVDLEQYIVQLENKSLLQEERLQEAVAEQNRLRKQLEDFAHEQQLQRNELAKTYAEEKLMLVKEQQQQSLEYENLQSRLQTIEKEKCDLTKLAAQLENKLLLQEEKMQEASAEINRLQNQLDSTKNEFYTQRNNLASMHAEEKKTFVEEQQRLLTECDNLLSQLNMLEQNKNNIEESITQKDALLLKFQNENFTYRNKIETMTANNKEIYTKCESLTEKQDKCEKELQIKAEKIRNLEAMLSVTKQRETNLVNDINRIEKKLNNEMDYSKNLENKLSEVQKELQLTHMQKTEMQKTIERAKVTNEFVNNEMQQLKTLQKENEEIRKQENARAKNAQALYENAQVKHAEEISALKSSYETRLLEMGKTIDHFKKENNNLKNNYQVIAEHNNDFQRKLKEATEMPPMKTIANRKSKRKLTKDQAESNTKRKYDLRLNPELMEMSETGQCNVSTSMELNDNEQDKSLSQSLYQIYSIEKESQNEQEAEVTSAGKKFFKSRPAQLRTYGKRRQNS